MVGWTKNAEIFVSILQQWFRLLKKMLEIGFKPSQQIMFSEAVGDTHEDVWMR